jgi:hypothetical protein
MTKTAKTRPPEVWSISLQEMIEANAGAGTSPHITDSGFWLDDIDEHGIWYAALQAIDDSNDKAPLIALLSKEQPPQSICRHLADLLERHDLRKRRKRGPQPIPSYDRSYKNVVLELAIMEVREWPAPGSVDTHSS